MSDDIQVHPEVHQNRLFFFWAQWIVRWRWVAIFLSFVLVVLSLLILVPAQHLPPQMANARLHLLGRPGLMINTSVEAFSDPKDKPALVLERYRDLFGRDDFFMVLIEGDVFSLPYLNRLNALHRELEKLNLNIDSLGERRGDREQRIRGSSLNKKTEDISPRSAQKKHTQDLDDTK